jgi:hypothetical protein
MHKKVRENQAGLELDGTHQFLSYADDVNLLGYNIDTIKKDTETLIDASKEVGLEINVEKTKYPRLQKKLQHKISKQIIGKCVTVQIFGNDSKK